MRFPFPVPRGHASCSARAPLTLEALESRDCPSIGSPPVISSMMITEMSNSTIQVSGVVEDEIPGTTTLTFTGLVTDSVTPNGDGTFSELYQVGQEGTVTGVVVDQDLMASQSVDRVFASSAPAITNLQYAWDTEGKYVLVSGTVQDEAPGGLTVQLSGAVSGSTTTDSGGAFSVRLLASSLTAVNATVDDQWSHTSQVASVTLTNNAPQIANFQVQYGPNGLVTITGQVMDEQPEGLTVTFTGLRNATVTVQADGSFSYSFTLGASESGVINATVTDWWNAESDEVSDYIE